MAPTKQQSTRQFATSSRVFPPYLPYLQAPKTPRAAKLIPSAVALAGIGYGVSMYRQSQAAKGPGRRPSGTEDEAERRRRNEELMSAYGDRDSLESLEEAIRVYESQQRR
ncbi:hypothetical protein RB595_000399 [Gaeumannomyces hyphopodioides]